MIIFTSLFQESSSWLELQKRHATFLNSLLASPGGVFVRLNFTAVVSNPFRDGQQKTLKSLSDQLQETQWLEREWPSCSLMFGESFETRTIQFCFSFCWDVYFVVAFESFEQPRNSLNARIKLKRTQNNHHTCSRMHQRVIRQVICMLDKPSFFSFWSWQYAHATTCYFSVDKKATKERKNKWSGHWKYKLFACFYKLLYSRLSIMTDTVGTYIYYLFIENIL